MRARAFIPNPFPDAEVGFTPGGRVTVAGAQVGTIVGFRSVDGGFEVDLDVEDPDTIAALTPPIPAHSLSYLEEDPHAPHH